MVLNGSSRFNTPVLQVLKKYVFACVRPSERKRDTMSGQDSPTKAKTVCVCIRKRKSICTH